MVDRKQAIATLKIPEKPKAVLWVPRDNRVLPNLDSKLWTHSKTTEQFLATNGL